MKKLHSYTNFTLITEAETKLKVNVPKDIVQLYKLFKKNNKELYVVGGAVRDALLGKKPKDFDLATDAFPQEVIDIVTKAGYSTIGEVGQQFGVVIVKVPSDPNGVEIATFREDIGKGRRPDAVEYSTIDKDVLRRDLTINALFYDIGRREVVDLVGGLEDIKNSKIRTVGVAADRFDEDPLRKLRALRFAGRTGSNLEKETANAILTDNSLKDISSERIRDEFKKSIVSAKSPKKYLEMVTEFGMWERMFPSLIINKNFVNATNWLVQLALLFGDNEKDVIKNQMNKLSFSNDEINAVIFLKALKEFNYENVYDLYKLLSKTKIDKNEIIIFSKINRLDLKMIKAFLKYKPTIKGGDVIKEFGVKGADVALKIKELESEKFKKSI